MTCVLEIVFRLPPTPVEKDHQRGTLRRCVGGQPQITKLILAGTIVDTMVSGRRGARQNVHSDRTIQSSLRMGGASARNVTRSTDASYGAVRLVWLVESWEGGGGGRGKITSRGRGEGI